jgi:hypothetical protein
MEGYSMNRQRLFSMLCYFFILSLLVINGCSKPILPIDKNEPLPPIIKTFKRVTIHAGTSGMRNTGVFIDVEDTYTIMATGSIDYCPSGGCGYNNVRPEDGWPLMAKIKKDGFFFRPIKKGRNYVTAKNWKSGYLFLGYKAGKVDIHGKALNPEYYTYHTGAFFVDIIVWKKDDYVQIAAFLEKMKARDPNNKVILDTLEYVNMLKNYQLAEAKASKEVDETKKMIEELKGDSKQKVQDDKTVAGEMANEKKIKELETKLTELMKTLTQLDEMKAQLVAEKKKTAQLSQELEEKDERERELLTRIEDGSKNPPVIVIAAPSDGQKTEGKIVQLSGVVEDDNGVKRLEITINNKILNRDDDRGIKEVGNKKFPRRFHFSEKVPLEKGVNQIMIRAIDSEGLYAKKVLTVHNIERRRNIWAVVIGINDYPNIRKLKYAVNDAKAFHELLISHNKIPEENVILLIGQKASLTNIRSSLGTKLKNKAGKEDMVIIYFAGHGATERDVMSPDGDGLEKYLLPYDADLKDLYSSALPMREISHIFHRIRSERIIFIADSCYSGASGGRTVSFSEIRSNISDAFLDRIIGGKGTIIITASGANEVSVENEKFRHGVFTHYLLEGLKGKADTDNDSLITVDEVYRYVSDQVPKATGQEQHPVKKGSVEGRLILGIVP